MEIETIILCTIFGVFILLSYSLGLKNGQKIIKQETIELPNLNPLNTIKNIQEKSEQKKIESEIMDSINELENFTPLSQIQKEV